MPIADLVRSSRTSRLVVRPWLLAWLALGLLSACAWESAAGPGSGVSREEVDARLAELVATLPRPAESARESESESDPDPESKSAEGDAPTGTWQRPAAAVAEADYGLRLEVDRIAHEHRDHVAAQWTSAVLAFEVADYETARAIRPDIIYCESTAFGKEGPDA